MISLPLIIKWDFSIFRIPFPGFDFISNFVINFAKKILDIRYHMHLTIVLGFRRKNLAENRKKPEKSRTESGGPEKHLSQFPIDENQKINNKKFSYYLPFRSLKKINILKCFEYYIKVKVK